MHIGYQTIQKSLKQEMQLHERFDYIVYSDVTVFLLIWDRKMASKQ